MSQKHPTELKIGEVVYILSNKNQALIPALVAEESIIKTLNGVSVSWKLQIGTGEKSKIIESTRIDGEIFLSLEDVKNVMTKRLQTYITNLLDSAKQKQISWYKKEAVSPETQEDSLGKITLDTKQPPSKEELREKLKSAIIPSENELNESDGNVFIDLDGSQFSIPVT
jgi:hypothetical protein